MPIKLPPAQTVSQLPDLSQPLAGSATTLKSVAGEFLVQRLVLDGSGRRAGVELLVIDTGRVRAVLLPTRGLSVWRAWIDGVELGWRSPVDGPVHPQWVALQESGGLGWLDGFDELLVRCGLRNFGAPDFDPATGRLTFPLHGRIGNLPTDHLELDLDAAHSLLHVRGVVNETRFLQYNLRLECDTTFAIDSPTIGIHDRVRNLGDTPTTMQMLYHINVGTPLLSAGAKLHLSSPRIVARNEHAANDLASWDSYLGPTPGYSEQVYFSASRPDSSGWTTALLASADAQRGFAVHYQTDSLPYFTQWKNTVGLRDGYVTGLEPGTGFPNPRSFEEAKGRVVTLDSQGSRDFNLKLEGIATATRVSELANKLKTQSNQQVETVSFDSQWCVPRN